MSEDDKTAPVEIVIEAPDKKAKNKGKAKTKNKAKAKAEAKTKSTRPKVAKATKPVDDFDFVGRVESLRVKSGAGPEGFEFGMRGRHGKRKSFRLDPGDAFALNAMMHLVLAAHAGETRIGVRTASEADGVLIVRELESRPKLGKSV